jgi:hypothetical protein
VIRFLRLGLAYFGIVFSVGFLLGMVRVSFFVPLLGERTAELLELPFMLAAIYFASSWLVRRYDLYGRPVFTLSVGILSAVLLLLAEFSVVLWIRGLTLSEYLTDRDPVAGTLYYIAVAVFAIMPAIISMAFRSEINEKRCDRSSPRILSTSTSPKEKSR